MPEGQDVREVVWEIACPRSCDPEGGPFAARIVLGQVTLTVAEVDPPQVRVSARSDSDARVTVSDLMGVERVEVWLSGRRLALRDTPTCEPSAGKLLRTRVPCSRRSDRRVVLDVRLPAGAAAADLEVRAADALGNEARRGG